MQGWSIQLVVVCEIQEMSTGYYLLFPEFHTQQLVKCIILTCSEHTKKENQNQVYLISIVSRNDPLNVNSCHIAILYAC